MKFARRNQNKNMSVVHIVRKRRPIVSNALMTMYYFIKITCYYINSKARKSNYINKVLYYRKI